MLSGLLDKLEQEHGIAPAQGSGILNTIAQHIKEQFPQIGGMLDSVLGTQSAATSATTNTVNPTTATNSGSTSSLEELEEMAKSKLGGIFGK